MTANPSESDIRDLVADKDFATLKATIGQMEIHDLAELLSGLEGDELAVVFRLLSQETAAEIFGDLEIEQTEELLTTLSSEKVASILNDMPPDDRTELLEELPGELAQRLLSTLRGEELQIARSLLAYPEDSIGRLMTPEYVAIRPQWTTEEVLQHIRKVAATKETLNVIYVVDERSKLLDELTLEDLVLAEPTQHVRDLMDRTVASLAASDDQESAVEIFKKYDALALPVVNSQGILVGIVTFDDVMDVVEEEATEDFQLMAGMEPLEYSYFGTGFWGMVRKRLPWLIMLLLAQTLTTIALINFQSVALFAVLILFMPLINSPAGNTGSQIAGVMIRSLAVQEINISDWWRVLTRELVRGLTFGIALGMLGYAAAMVFSSYVDTGSYQPSQIAMSVAMALTVAVTLGNLIGCMLPLLFKRIGLDPAVTSAPFIASLMDVSGIMIYFAIAIAMLR